ncbi:MAG: hypothetical protein LBJ69_04140 [Holosporales bacterium]|jgi:hypothetical protein|nr:hypothetical protein [Holosporales bacterium]
MILKLLWVSFVVLLALGILFFASFGFQIPVSYYEKTDVVIASNRPLP